MNTEQILSSLENCKGDALKLKNKSLDDDNVSHIVLHLLNNSNITSLDLSDNKLTDKCINSLSELLLQSNSLTELKLHGTKITKSGITNLSNYIKSNTCLLNFDTDPELLTEKTESRINNALNMHKKILQGVVNEPDQVIKENFINDYWMPFKDNLTQLLEIVKLKTLKNYDLHQRMPSQKTFFILQNQCLQLTELWYGKGKSNLSCLYSFFCAMCEAAKIVFYRFDDIPFYQSEDGFISAIDEHSRIQASSIYQDAISMPYIRQGGKISSARSPIDDLNISGIMRQADANQFLALDYMKKLIIGFIRLDQEEILAKSKKISSDIITHAIDQKIHLIEKTDAALLLPHGIDKKNLSCQMLIQYGEKIENWGQLPQIWKELIHKHLQDETFKYNGHGIEKTVYDKFCEHLSGEPGTYYKNLEEIKKDIPGADNIRDDKELHSFVQTVGVLSGNLSVINRSKMEEHTIHRYFAIEWIRDFSLEGFDKNNNLLSVRKPNDREQMRLRINQMPYKHQHCISITTSGLVEGLQHHDSQKYNWNIPIDENSIISNSFRDIEKIAKELVLLNPCSAINNLLPGEQYIDVAQNTMGDSSIKETQHIHTSRAYIEDTPLFKQNKNPSWIGRIQASVDFIQVGDNEDAFFVKIITEHPTYPPLLKCLINFWRTLLQKYNNNIDLYIHMLANGDQFFSIILIPQAPTVRTDTGKIKNLDTKEIRVKHGLPIRLSQEFDEYQNDGKLELKLQYDFLAKLGSKKLSTTFFSNLSTADLK